jgi:hypothetical protein
MTPLDNGRHPREARSMALRYRTEYHLGRFGGRVSRTYGGLQALLAIGIDLALSLVFGVIWFALSLAWGILVVTYKFALELLRVPPRAIRWAFGRAPSGPAAKPAWAGIDEL